jgi:hypothetical protein
MAKAKILGDFFSPSYGCR